MIAVSVDELIQTLSEENGGDLGKVIGICVTEKIKAQNGLGWFRFMKKEHREKIAEKYSQAILRLAEIMYPPK